MDIQQAQQWFDQGQLDDLLEEMNKSFSGRDQIPPDWRKLMAYVLQRKGHFEEAMLHWNVLSVSHPEDAYVFLERGVCKFNLRFKHALEDFDYALQLQPQNAYFHAAKAFVLDKIGRISEAVEHYEISLQLDPENEITLNNLAVTEQKRGNQSKAEEWMRKTDELLKSKGILPASALNSQAESSDPQPELPLNETQISSEEGENSLGLSKNKWHEVRKMMSSRQEFSKFLKEALKLLRNEKK